MKENESEKHSNKGLEGTIELEVTEEKLIPREYYEFGWAKEILHYIENYDTDMEEYLKSNENYLQKELNHLAKVKNDQLTTKHPQSWI